MVLGNVFMATTCAFIWPSGRLRNVRGQASRRTCNCDDTHLQFPPSDGVNPSKTGLSELAGDFHQILKIKVCRKASGIPWVCLPAPSDCLRQVHCGVGRRNSLVNLSSQHLEACQPGLKRYAAITHTFHRPWWHTSIKSQASTLKKTLKINNKKAVTSQLKI